MSNLSPVISNALKKSKISGELIAEFTDFLHQHSNWESQALYLLKEKKQKIETIVENLYGVPAEEQLHWKNDKPKVQKEIENLVSISQTKASISSDKKILFRDWLEEHALFQATSSEKNTRTTIRITPFIDKDFQQKFRWLFSEIKYKKRGGQVEKSVSDILESISEDYQNPNWSAKDYLKNNPRIKNSLTNPLILDGEESNYFMNILFGHLPMFFDGVEKTLIQNTISVDWKLQYKNLENYRLIYITFSLPPKEFPFDFDKHREEIFILGGVQKAMLIQNNYWKFNVHRLAASMIREAIKGILVPEQEWTEFLEKWKELFPDITIHKSLEEEKFFSETTLDFSINKLKEWQFWLQASKKNKPIFQDKNKIPEFYISTKIRKYNYHYLGLKIKNYPQENCLENPESCPQIVKLFEYLEHISPLKKENGEYLMDRVIASQFLTLAKNYPHLYNNKKEPLLEVENSLYFAITIMKSKTSPKKYLLKGNLYQKKIINEKEEWIPFLKGNTYLRKIVGLIPSFLLYKEKIYGIENIVNGKLIEDCLNTIYADETDISDFYTNVYPVLQARNIRIFDPEGLLEISAIFYYKLRGSITIREVRGILMGELQVIMKTEIGDFEYPIYEKSKTFSKVYKGRVLSIPKNKKMEAKLFEAIEKDGWIEEARGVFSMREHKAIHFVLYTLTNQSPHKPITYYGMKNLKRWKVYDSIPTTNLDIKSKTDWFELNFDFENYNIDIEKIIKIWQTGQRHIDFRGEKGLVRIDQNWINQYAPILNRLFHSQDKTRPKDNQKILVHKQNFGLLQELKNINKKKSFSLENFKIVPQTIPSTVQAKLRNYQKEGVDWLCFLRKNNFGGILADDMGLGKTIQALTYFEILRQSKKKIQRPNLVVCPTSVLLNWEEEIHKFVPEMKFVVYHGNQRQKYDSQLKKMDLIITTYSLLQKETSLLQKIKYDVILLDEAQNIKNANSKTAKNVCILKAKQRISLTGTPIENNILELWSQFHFLMPNFLGSYQDFQKTYVKTSKNQKKEKEYNFSLLRKQTKVFILRRIKQNVAKSLPPKTEQIIYCEMGAAQRKFYNAVLASKKKMLLSKIESNSNPGQIKISFFDALLKLRQICCDPRLNNLSAENPPPSAKLELFLSHLEEIVAEGHRVLVFSQFVKMLHLIQESLVERNISFLQLDGSTKNRNKVIKKFQNESNYPVFLISLKAGGVGLNLTAADYVIHYDPWWNPAVESQASDRAYRIGQDKHVFVYKLVTKDSIEEKIISLQQKKMSLTDNIITVFKNFDEMIKVDTIKEIFS